MGVMLVMMLEDGFKINMVSVKLVKDIALLSEKPIHNPDDLIDVMGEYMSQFDKEVIFVLNLNDNNQIINGSMVSMGTLNYAVFHPRELFKSTVLSNASRIMMLHNHPSGNVLPSKDDICVTDNLCKACEIMGIELLDHIIVGGRDGSYFSFRDKCLIKDKTVYYATELQDINIRKRGM